MASVYVGGSIFMEYNNEEEMKEAERAVTHLWNIGKVVSSGRGEWYVQQGGIRTDGVEETDPLLM